MSVVQDSQATTASSITPQVHPDVRKYTLESRKRASTVEQLEYQLMSPPVVATTCLSIDQYVFPYSWS